MTDPLIGERWSSSAPRYINHPPAATSLLRDGNPVDAGTEMMIRNNLAHLAEESLRQIFVDTSVAQPSTSNTDGWTSLVDEAPPTGDAAWSRAPHQLISWDQRTANCYGPLPLVADRTVPSGTGPGDGAITFRKLRIRIDANCDGASTFYVALTVGDRVNPGDFFGGTSTEYFGCFASDTPAAGTAILEIDLEPAIPARNFLPVPMRARATGEHGAIHTPCQIGYLWIGANPPSGVTIYSVTVYEIL